MANFWSPSKVLLAWVMAASLPVQADAVAERTLLLVTAPYPPFVNPEGDPQGEGIDIEIAREALRRGGYQTQLRLVPWKRALAMLENGTADLTTTISRNGERSRFLAWSDGYRNTVRYRFYARKGSPHQLTALPDLDGRSLALTLGFFYPDAITQRPGLRVHTGSSLANTVKMLDAGRADFLVINQLAGQWEINRLGLADRLSLQSLEYASDSPTYMAFSRKRPFEAPLAALSAGLRSMAKDGSVQRIEMKYVGQ